jgi:hypothetical protein
MWTIGNFIRAFSFIMPAESRSDVRLAVVEAGGEPEGTGKCHPRVPSD